MSELREAAQAVLNDYERGVSIVVTERVIARLRAALAQPETEPEPVAWQVRWIDPEEGPGAWRFCLDPSEADYYANREDHDWRPLYAHPPRDEWREAAEEALRWMEHARLHLTIKERMHPDGLSLYDSAAEALRAALAQPEPEAPRDEWRPASDPPDTTRSVLIWLRFGDVETFGKTLGGPSGFAFQNGAITHWRDVTPPTEGA